MVSGELGGRWGRAAGATGGGGGARVAWDGGAVVWGPALWPCNQSDILEVWHPPSNNIRANDHVKAPRRKFKTKKPVIVGIDPI
jgi:hypothetical protein